MNLSPQFVASVVTLLVVFHVMQGAVAYLILLERKIASWVQDRIGPNRVGPYGLLQPIADGLKFILKEDYTPPNVDRVLFLAAPVMAVVPALMGWAVMPWGGYMAAGTTVFPGVTLSQDVLISAAPINVGVIYILAIGSLAVYGVVVGGYASNNKYSFLGGMRATAQMLSYEIPMAMSVLIMILMFGTPRADMLANMQSVNTWHVIPQWGILLQPLLAVIFFACILAECNRAPFDLAECEQELVGGYHTEYSSMKFALFFMGEYSHMVSGSAFFALLFLGGWDIPFVQEPLAGGWIWVLVKAGSFAFKVAALLAFMMLIRWTLPRFRFDQLMRLAWRALIPVTIVLLLTTGLIVLFNASLWWNLPANVLVFFATMMLGGKLPQGPPVNRRVGLEGSRFSPVKV